MHKIQVKVLSYRKTTDTHTQMKKAVADLFTEFLLSLNSCLSPYMIVAQLSSQKMVAQSKMANVVMKKRVKKLGNAIFYLLKSTQLYDRQIDVVSIDVWLAGCLPA